eukprot:105274-Pyramimonas_sp.AAC.1
MAWTRSISDSGYIRGTTTFTKPTSHWTPTSTPARAAHVGCAASAATQLQTMNTGHLVAPRMTAVD